MEPQSKPLPKIKKCSTCGTTVNDFHKTAFLGCANCYNAFSSEVRNMAAAAHGAGAVHKGKDGGTNV